MFKYACQLHVPPGHTQFARRLRKGVGLTRITFSFLRNRNSSSIKIFRFVCLCNILDQEFSEFFPCAQLNKISQGQCVTNFSFVFK